MIDSPLLDGLSPEDRRRVLDLFTRRAVPSGSVLLQEREPCDSLYVVASGTLTVETEQQGKLGHVGPGECLGEVSLFSDQPASATVAAVTEVVVWVAAHEEIRAVLPEAPVLASNFCRLLGQRLVRRTAKRKQRRLVLLAGSEASVGTGFAVNLAAGVAWYSGDRVALVDASPVTPSPSAAAEPAFEYPHASVTVARAGMLSPDRLHALVEGLAGEHGFVLVWTRAETAGASLFGARLEASVTQADVRLLIVGHEACRKVGAVVRSETIAPELVVLGVPGPCTPATARRIERETGLKLAALLPASDGSLAEPAAVSDFAPDRDATPFSVEIGRLARRLAGKRVGLALGSGAGRGHGHIWVLRALEQLGVTPDVIAGTSVGAVVGGRFAAGFSWEEIAGTLQAFGQMRRRWSLPIHSLMHGGSIDAFYRQGVGEELQLEDLACPCAFIAADFATGEEVVLRQGSVWRSARATCSMPGIMPPTPLDGRLLVDGGIVSPVPCRAARELGADVVIGVSLEVAPASGGESGPSPAAAESQRPTWPATLVRSYDILQRGLTRLCLREADVSIRVFTPPINLLDFRGGPAFVEAAERAVAAAHDPLAAALPWVR